MAEEGTSGEILCPPNSCPVCLGILADRQLGKPENCTHLFCLSCIFEWSKNVNTCPVDRVSFNYIEVLKSDTEQQAVPRKIYIPDRRFEDVLVDPEGLTYCEICHQCDREDLLLLCDGCDKGYHIYCLTSPLERIPRGNWYCHNCHPIISGQEIVSATSSVPTIYVDEGEDSSYRLSSREEGCTSTDDMMVIDQTSGEVSEEEEDDESIIVMLSRTSRPCRIKSSSSSEQDSGEKHLAAVKNPTKTQPTIAGKFDPASSSPVSSINSGSGSLSDTIKERQSVKVMFVSKTQQFQSDTDTLSSSPVVGKGKKRACKLDSFSCSSTESLVSGTCSSEIEHISDTCSDLYLRKGGKPKHWNTLPVSTSANQDQPYQTNSNSTHMPTKRTRRRSQASLKRRRKYRRRMQKMKKLNGGQLIDNTCSSSSFTTPPRRARTVATSGSSPWLDRSFREAVIASHRHKHSADGLREARKVLQEARQDTFCSPQKQFGYSLYSSHQPSNVTIPHHHHPTLQPDQPHRAHNYQHQCYTHESPTRHSAGMPHFPDYRKEFGDIAGTPQSTPSLYTSGHTSQPNESSSPGARYPTFGKPRKLNLSSIGMPTTTDYVGQIQENLEDLSSNRCVFNRDGSIIPIRDSSHTVSSHPDSSYPASAVCRSPSNLNKFSRKDETRHSLSIEATSSERIPGKKKKVRRRKRKLLNYRRTALKCPLSDKEGGHSTSTRVSEPAPPTYGENWNSNNNCVLDKGNKNSYHSQTNYESLCQQSERLTDYARQQHCDDPEASFQRATLFGDLCSSNKPSCGELKSPLRWEDEHLNVVTGFPPRNYDPYLDYCDQKRTSFDAEVCNEDQPHHEKQSYHKTHENQSYMYHENKFDVSTNRMCDLGGSYQDSTVQRGFHSPRGATFEGLPDPGNLQLISCSVPSPDHHPLFKQEEEAYLYFDGKQIGSHTNCHHSTAPADDMSTIHSMLYCANSDSECVSKMVSCTLSPPNSMKNSAHLQPTPLFKTEPYFQSNSPSSYTSLTVDECYIAPATGQSVSVSSLLPLPPPPTRSSPLPFLVPLNQTNSVTVTAAIEQSSLLVNLDRASGQSLLSMKHSTTMKECVKSGVANNSSLSSSAQQVLKPLSMCMLDSDQAVTAVKRHLELHYIAGNITAAALENIKKRAVKKVQLAKKVVPLERVRKLVDEYVILHKQHTEPKHDTV